MTQRWYVVNTIGGQERTADDTLKRKGRETYLPLEQRTVLHARSKNVVLKPLYPTYLFVRFDPFDLSWGEILHLPGVWTIIGITRPSGHPREMRDVTGANWRPYVGQPRAVADRVVEALKALLDSLGGSLPEERSPTAPVLEPGTAVVVAFSDVNLSGLVDAQVGNRVRVLLDLMGRRVPTIVPRDSVSLLAQ